MTTTARILVVDDEPGVRRLVADALALDGHDVTVAADGDEALELLGRGSFDAVVLDRSMPGTDGLDVLRAIRADPVSSLTPVLLVTGLDQPDERITGLDVGADDYIVKPFDPDELVARVRSRLRGQRAWTERLTAAVEQRRTLLARAATRAALADDEYRASAALLAEVVTAPEVAGAGLVDVSAGRPTDLGAQGISGRALLALADQGEALDAIEAGLPGGPRVFALPDRSVVAVPVTAGETTLAVLVVTSELGIRGATADPLLAMAIDFAAICSAVLSDALLASHARSNARRRFDRIVEQATFHPVFQPIIDLTSTSTVGFEALTRFDETINTERMFVDAAALGAGFDLEEATLGAAMHAAHRLPPGAWLAVNVTPSMILESSRLSRLLDLFDRETVVLEISELEPVRDYDELRAAIGGFEATVQLSVDDAGSGFASLAHILALGARFVKLDRSWVNGIEHDPAKRALVHGLQTFAEETGSALIAEGVETQPQLDVITGIGISYAQGYLLGRPAVI